MSGGYEKSDVTIGGIVQFAVVLTVATAVVMALMGWMFWSFQERAALADAAERDTTELRRGLPTQPPEPVLQGAPGSKFELQSPLLEMEAWETEMDEQLSGVGWVDRNAGTVRIPIDDAKRLLLDRGLPVREGG